MTNPSRETGNDREISQVSERSSPLLCTPRRNNPLPPLKFSILGKLMLCKPAIQLCSDFDPFPLDLPPNSPLLPSFLPSGINTTHPRDVCIPGQTLHSSCVLTSIASFSKAAGSLPSLISCGEKSPTLGLDKAVFQS